MKGKSKRHRWNKSVSKCYFVRLKIKQWIAGLDLGHSKLFIFIFVKEWIKRIFAKNIRHLVNETIVPLTQRIILKIVWFQIGYYDPWYVGKAMQWFNSISIQL